MENKFRSIYPEKVNRVEIKIDIDPVLGVDSYLLLDGKRHHTVRVDNITSADFGVYNNIPWYDVPFPGDNGEEYPEDEHLPQIVFETLRRLVQLVKNAIDKKSPTVIDITKDLKDAGCEFYVSIFTDKDAEIYSQNFLKWYIK